MRRILIAGVGNVFLGDDAFGSLVARRCAQIAWPEGVTVRDFGIRGLDLAYALLDPKGWDGVILIDVVRRGQPPGTLLHLEIDPERELPTLAPVQGHGLDVSRVIALARRIGAGEQRALPRLHLVGCEPLRFDPVEGERDPPLSPPVAGCVRAAVVMLRRLAATLAEAPFPEVQTT